METLVNIVAIVGGLVGFGVFVSAVVGLGKTLGFVADGQSGLWVTGMNLLAVVAIFVTGVAGVSYDIEKIDGILQLFGDALVAFTQLFLALGGSKLFYSLTKGKVPVIGKTFSG